MTEPNQLNPEDTFPDFNEIHNNPKYSNIEPVHPETIEPEPEPKVSTPNSIQNARSTYQKDQNNQSNHPRMTAVDPQDVDPEDLSSRTIPTEQKINQVDYQTYNDTLTSLKEIRDVIEALQIYIQERQIPDYELLLADPVITIQIMDVLKKRLYKYDQIAQELTKRLSDPNAVIDPTNLKNIEDIYHYLAQNHPEQLKSHRS